MKKIPAIDMHCDTIGLIRSRDVQAEILKTGRKKSGSGYDFTFTEEELKNPISLRRNSRMIDAERLKEGGYMCQSFAMYVSEGAANAAQMGRFEYLCSTSDLLDREIEKNSDILRYAYSGSDIEKNFSDGFVSCLKTVEEGLPYEGKLENLKEAYRRGVRKSTLTWNYENELAFGNKLVRTENGSMVMVPDTENGLKKTGFEFVEAMEDMGMIIDVAHLSDAGIRDIFNTVKPSTPIISSHSNARAVCSHARNLTDEFLRLMAEHGGVTGINVCSAFLAEDQMFAKERVTRISDMIRHMQHIKNVAGIDTVALGTDFDGTSGRLELGHAGEIQKLACELDRAGFTEEEIEKIYYKNALRVYKEVLG